MIGNSGSGKTTFGSRLAERLGVPFLEMDALRHLPGWQELPDDEFRARVATFVQGPAWVIDGNYTAIVREVVWERATHVAWMDLPRSRVMRQVIARSFVRAFSRRELWNRNRELWRHWVRPDHPIRWAWTQHRRKTLRDEAMLADPRWAHLTAVRIRSRAEAEAWIARPWCGSPQA